GREAAEHDFGTVGVGREGLDRPGAIAHRAGLVVGVEPSPEEDEGPAFGLLGPYEVDHLSSGELSAGVLLAVGDGHDEQLLRGLAGGGQLGGSPRRPIDDGAGGIEQRGRPARLEVPGTQRYDLGDGYGLEDELSDVVVVELDEGHAGV